MHNAIAKIRGAHNRRRKYKGTAKKVKRETQKGSSGKINPTNKREKNSKIKIKRAKNKIEHTYPKRQKKKKKKKKKRKKEREKKNLGHRN